ncbi:MAG: hypothetical protein Q9187_005434, partial [Circinaria calcarea]
GRAQILPPLDDNILEVAIGLSRAHMKWLKEDELFAQYAKFQGGSDAISSSRSSQVPLPFAPTLTTRLYTPDSLRASPILPDLTSMINDAFAQTHLAIIPAGGPLRFSTPTHLVDSLQGTGFLFVTSDAANNDLIIAVAEAKPWRGSTADGARGKVTQNGTVPNGEKLVSSEAAAWEITAVAVRQEAPYQSRGLARALLSLIDAEIIRRVSSKTDRTSCVNSLHSPLPHSHSHSLAADGPLQRIRLVIRTLQAVNGAYWVRQGYIPVSEGRVTRGLFGNTEEVVSVTMERWIEGEGGEGERNRARL